jgi:hypothetical protein
MKAIEDAAIVSGEIVGDDLILVRYDETTLNAGNVRGPIGPMSFPNPVGTILMGGWTVAPTGYLLLNGQVISGGVVSYPELAAIYPDWIVGPDLHLPATVDAVPMGATTDFGVVAGSMTHTLTNINQLPSHNHTMLHTHAGPNHRHTMDHGHGHNISASMGSGGSHGHNEGGYDSGANTGFLFRGGAGAFGWESLNGSGSITKGYQYPQVQSAGSSHFHTISVSGGVTSTSGALTGFDGTGTSGPASNHTTTAVGESASIDHTPKHIKVTYIVKY